LSISAAFSHDALTPREDHVTHSRTDCCEEGGFIALNPETGTKKQGETVSEEVLYLKEAKSLYLEEFS
jgi:hypothetical protein